MRISRKIMLSMLVAGCTSFAAFGMEDSGPKSEGTEEATPRFPGLSDFESKQILQKIADLDVNEYSGLKKAIGRLCQLRRVSKKFKNYLTSQKIAEILLDNGFNANAINENGDTMLVRAVKDNVLEIVKVFIAAGANVNAAGRWVENGMPLIEAVIKKNHEIVAAIIAAQGFDPKAGDQAKIAFRTAVKMRYGAIEALIAGLLTKEEALKIRKSVEDRRARKSVAAKRIRKSER
jgi:hypothetical protein